MEFNGSFNNNESASTNETNSADESKTLESSLQQTHSVNQRDLDLTRRVREHVKWDKRVSEADVHVYSRSGHVTLIGKVDSLFKKNAASEVVRLTKGVVKVINLLEIPGSFVREDLVLRNLITNRISELCLSGKERIFVHVEKGVVRLEGIVSSLRKKADAAGSVWELSGVRDCINLVKIDHAHGFLGMSPVTIRPTESMRPNESMKEAGKIAFQGSHL